MAYNSTTGLDAKGFLGERLGESEYWTAQEKLDAFNEGLLQWQAMIGEFTAVQSLPIISGQVYYEVPRQVASVSRVLHNGKALFTNSLEGLDLSGNDWENSSPATPLQWAPVGFTMIAIYPPGTSGTLTFEGIGEALILRNDGDQMDLGEESLDPILSYAHHVLTFKEGGAEFTSTQVAMQKMMTEAAQRNSKLISSATYRRLMGKDQNEVLRKPRAPVETLGGRG